MNELNCLKDYNRPRLSRRMMLRGLAAAGITGLTAVEMGCAKCRRPTLGAESRPLPIWVIDAEHFTTDQRLTMAALQGIVNRNQPRVFLNYGRSLAFMRFGFDPRSGQQPSAWNPTSAQILADKYYAIDDYWIAELAHWGLFRFQVCTVQEVIRRYASHLKGLILYHKIDDDMAVAATMAGLRDAIPVTPQVLGQWFMKIPHLPPTIFDVGSLYSKYPHGIPRRIAAQRWAIQHLLPECSKAGVFSRVFDYGLAAYDTLPSVDLAIQQRWFTFQLDFGNSIAHPTHNPKRMHNIELESSLINKILNQLKPWAPVYGWGEPGENTMVDHISRLGHVLINTQEGNLTFFKGMPMVAKPFGQPGAQNIKPRLEDKIYIAFMVNEGDTIKCLESLENAGSWLQPERGRFPINWGMDPLLYREFPGLVSYYHKSATSNDYFFAACSCWGYTHPDAIPDNLILPYARLIRQGLRATGLSIGDIWWDTSLKKRGLWNSFLTTSGLRGLTQWSNGYQCVEYPVENVPVIYSPYYYTLKDPTTMAQQLLTQGKQINGPWFVVIYGGMPTGTPYLFEQVLKRLPQEQFEPVRLDDFFALARQAQFQIQGWRWEQNKMVKV
ncbi:MAG: GxGYxYP family putative glycoside hydrolase [Planctomycetia bacterium]|nr:GxGYxYP family putative glycoside hydrolase [Planctomycetia bacterium]